MPEPGAGSGGARGGSGMGAGDPGGYGAGVGDVDPIGYGVSAGRGSGHWVSMGKSGPEWVSTPSLIETYLEDHTLPKAAPVKAAPRRPPPRSLPAPIEYEAKKHAPRPAPPPPVSRPDPKPAGRPVVTGTSVAPSAKVALKFTDKAKEAAEKLAVRSGAAGSDMQKYGKFSPVMSTLLDMIEQDIPLQDPKYVSDSPKWRPMFPLTPTNDYAKNMPNFYANLPPETVERLFHSQMPVIPNLPKEDIDYDQVENNIFQKAGSTINYTPKDYSLKERFNPYTLSYEPPSYNPFDPFNQWAPLGFTAQETYDHAFIDPSKIPGNRVDQSQYKGYDFADKSFLREGWLYDPLQQAAGLGIAGLGAAYQAGSGIAQTVQELMQGKNPITESEFPNWQDFIGNMKGLIEHGTKGRN